MHWGLITGPACPITRPRWRGIKCQGKTGFLWWGQEGNGDSLRKWSPNRLQKSFISPWMARLWLVTNDRHRLCKEKWMWATPEYAMLGFWSQYMVYCASYRQCLLNLEVIPLMSHIFLFLLWDPCEVLSYLCPESKLGKKNTLSFRKGTFKLISCLWINFPLQPVCLGEDLRRR